MKKAMHTIFFVYIAHYAQLVHECVPVYLVPTYRTDSCDVHHPNIKPSFGVMLIFDLQLVKYSSVKFVKLLRIRRRRRL